MNRLRIKKVAVIGAGMMGKCIGLEFARFGYEVVLHDLLEEQLEKSLRSVQEELDLMVEAELIPSDVARAALGRLRTTTDIAEAASGADHIVEAVPEDLALKQELFARLDELCPAHVSLATNTSILKVDDCAAKARNFPGAFWELITGSLPISFHLWRSSEGKGQTLQCYEEWPSCCVVCEKESSFKNASYRQVRRDGEMRFSGLSGSRLGN